MGKTWYQAFKELLQVLENIAANRTQRKLAAQCAQIHVDTKSKPKIFFLVPLLG